MVQAYWQLVVFPCACLFVQEVDLAITADLGTLQRLPAIVGHGELRGLGVGGCGGGGF